jgi:hypothetical protein
VRDFRELLCVRSVDDLSRRHRLVLAYAVGLAGIIFFYTVVSNTGMRMLEGEQHSMFRSFQTVVETMTTTGYGADSPWSTPWMNLLVVGMQLSGVAIGFFTLRVLIIPLFKRTPVHLDERLTPKDDHVVVADYNRDSDVLMEELERLDNRLRPRRLRRGGGPAALGRRLPGHKRRPRGRRDPRARQHQGCGNRRRRRGRQERQRRADGDGPERGPPRDSADGLAETEQAP